MPYWANCVEKKSVDKKAEVSEKTNFFKCYFWSTNRNHCKRDHKKIAEKWFEMDLNQGILNATRNNNTTTTKTDNKKIKHTKQQHEQTAQTINLFNRTMHILLNVLSSHPYSPDFFLSLSLSHSLVCYYFLVVFEHNTPKVQQHEQKKSTKTFLFSHIVSWFCLMR